MTLLLDTHVWLWSLLRPERLSEEATCALNDSANTLALSPISLWETLVLAEGGRVLLHPDPWSWVRTSLRIRPLRQMPLTFEIALASRTIRIDGNDPADRFLAATAVVHDLTLLTADTSLLRSPDIRTVAAS